MTRSMSDDEFFCEGVCDATENCTKVHRSYGEQSCVLFVNDEPITYFGQEETNYED